MTDWKKTGIKVLKYMVVTFISGVVVQLQNDPRYMVLVPFILGGLNAFKHRYDWATVCLQTHRNSSFFNLLWSIAQWVEFGTHLFLSALFSFGLGCAIFTPFLAISTPDLYSFPKKEYFWTKDLYICLVLRDICVYEIV